MITIQKWNIGIKGSQNLLFQNTLQFPSRWIPLKETENIEKQKTLAMTQTANVEQQKFLEETENVEQETTGGTAPEKTADKKQDLEM